MNTTESLLQYWKRNQKQIQLFWNEWSKGYLLSLRETLPLAHKGPRSQVRRQPELGEIVIVRDSGLPRRVGKLAKVVKLIKRELFNKTILERTVNYLYPLEIKSVIFNEDDPAKSTTTQPATSTFEGFKKQSTRKAAVEALT